MSKKLKGLSYCEGPGNLFSWYPNESFSTISNWVPYDTILVGGFRVGKSYV